MTPHFTFLGLTFYWYGLVIGLAIALTMIAVDYRAAQHDRQHPKSRLQLFFQQWSMVPIIGGFIGARLWHVMTDWQLYQLHWQDALSLTSGGLSIIGAVLGGALSLVLLRRFSLSARNVPLLTSTDAVAFGLPIGQAFGRLGNWINQELYGLPADLPWAVSIEPQNRLAGFEAVEKYHPLFLYESLLMILFGFVIWKLMAKQSALFGTGFFTLFYLLYYSAIRFGLDFLRLDRPAWQFGVGINQAVLLGIFCISLFLMLRLVRNKRLSQTNSVQKERT